MPSVTVEEVQTRLPEILDLLNPGEELIITHEGRAVARLTSEPPKRVPILGGGRGTVLYMAPDFDSPLEEFREYMQ